MKEQEILEDLEQEEQKIVDLLAGLMVDKYFATIENEAQEDE